MDLSAVHDLDYETYRPRTAKRVNWARVNTCFRAAILEASDRDGHRITSMLAQNLRWTIGYCHIEDTGDHLRAIADEPF